LARNSTAKLDTSVITNQYADWGTKILTQDFDGVTASITKSLADTDAQYQTYQASLITPAPNTSASGPRPVAASSTITGYSYQTVSTSRGSFTVSLIKLRLADVTVKTVTANSSNCSNNCPTKSLASYVQENGAYAGMNGSYFCPPDYASCAGKVNTFDFAVYNTNLGVWINEPASHWNSVGLATFSNRSAHFYRRGQDYAGEPITAAISNFPPLLVQNGAVVTTTSEQDAYMQNKGTKGALGVDGTNIYLGQATNANVTDMAYIMQALGATDVLNMDGGGSAAMYIGGTYKVGPGRSLPNAIVLVKN
jgi:hypothetical protein